MNSLLAITLKAYKAIAGYLWASPAVVFGPTQCKYWPSCSQYSHMAVARYGLGKGGVMTIKRIIRCNPLSRGGVDIP